MNEITAVKSLIEEIKELRREKRDVFFAANPMPCTPARRQWRELGNRIANISDDGDIGFMSYWQNRAAWMRGL